MFGVVGGQNQHCPTSLYSWNGRTLDHHFGTLPQREADAALQCPAELLLLTPSGPVTIS